MNKVWNTSVNEVMKIFRGALISISPWLESAKIYDKDELSYDAFDNISNALYENIVCSALSGEVSNKYSIAKYGLHYDNYTPIGFIEVLDKRFPNNMAFVDFQSKELPYDTVKVAILNEAFETKENILINYKDLNFYYSKIVNGKRAIINEFVVVL